MDMEKWLKDAQHYINRLDNRKEFTLRELFKGTEWNLLSRGEKLSFGRAFKNEVKEGNIPGVICIGQAKNNSTAYIIERK